ncbi:MAG TPA: hypothetical protein VFR94_10585, partial [Nitrososphaeraceae archaeon]|nr:hypothetical protein [Nitrososphaeraceae archaeon]
CASFMISRVLRTGVISVSKIGTIDKINGLTPLCVMFRSSIREKTSYLILDPCSAFLFLKNSSLLHAPKLMITLHQHPKNKHDIAQDRLN